MKTFAMISLMALSLTAFAQDKKAANPMASQTGQNANAEHASCLDTDKCPSQMCSNSCAMINRTQVGDDRSSGNGSKGSKNPKGSIGM